MRDEIMFGGEGDMYGAPRRRTRERRTKPVVRVADERTVPTRRQLLHHLICVRSGLLGDGKGNGGLASAAGTDLSFVDQISEPLDELITAAKDVTTDLEDFRLALTTGSEALASLVGAEAAPPEEAAPAAPVQPQEVLDDLPDFYGFE